jgi:hypothetical protein
MRPPRAKADPRPRQETSAELVNDLLQAIRSGFYADAEKRFFQDRAFLLRNVVLWPAQWLNQRGVWLEPARYKAIVLEVLTTVKRHGDTGAVQFVPGYLMHCVQQHFKHQEEAIYEEARAMRTLCERALFAAGRAVPVENPNTALLEARRLITIRRVRKAKAESKQGVLL